jgi:hypothetical protein
MGWMGLAEEAQQFGVQGGKVGRGGNFFNPPREQQRTQELRIMRCGFSQLI